METKIKAFLIGYGGGDVDFDGGGGGGDVDGGGGGGGGYDGGGGGGGGGDGGGGGGGGGDGDGDGDGGGCGGGDGDGGGGGGYDGDGGGGYDGGEKITIHQGKKVYYIDQIPCVFESVHDNWAAVLIIDQNDFSTRKAFIAKLDGQFAHGETIKEAFAAVTDKVMDNMDIEEKKRLFFEKFPLFSAEYPIIYFFSWHHVITGSCDLGRRDFARSHNINLDGTMSVKSFIELTKESYNGSMIEELEVLYAK